MCSSYEEHQERKTVVKTLEEYSRNRAAFREDELILIQVCPPAPPVHPDHAGRHQSILDVWRESRHDSRERK